MDTQKTDLGHYDRFPLGPKGWKRLIRGFFILLVTLIGLWSIIATGGGSSGGGSSSGSTGTVSGSAT